MAEHSDPIRRRRLIVGVAAAVVVVLAGVVGVFAYLWPQSGAHPVSISEAQRRFDTRRGASAAWRWTRSTFTTIAWCRGVRREPGASTFGSPIAVSRSRAHSESSSRAIHRSATSRTPRRARLCWSAWFPEGDRVRETRCHTPMRPLGRGVAIPDPARVLHSAVDSGALCAQGFPGSPLLIPRKITEVSGSIPFHCTGLGT